MTDQQPTKDKQQNDDYDSFWKEALEFYFQDCLAFFFPEAHADIDWTQKPVFLDKELRKISYDAELGRHTVDKLARVWQKTGDEAWVLVHVEAQGQWEDDFTRRMYTYNYRLFDRYGRRVASFAILGDELPNWRPDHYRYELWGSEAKLTFSIVKLLDYREKWEALEQSKNPFAVVVMAHLHAQATRKKPDERYTLKWSLTRRLYEQGYSKKDIRLLFRFIDWLLVLPAELTQKFTHELVEYEEEQKMRYVTQTEALLIKESLATRYKEGREEGWEEGREEGWEEGREEGREEGERKAMLKTLNQALTIRFDVVLGKFDEQFAELSLKSLEQLNEVALKVNALAEFEKALGEMPRKKQNDMAKNKPKADKNETSA